MLSGDQPRRPSQPSNDCSLADRLGQPPEGRGLLGVLATADQPLRLDDLQAQPKPESKSKSRYHCKSHGDAEPGSFPGRCRRGLGFHDYGGELRSPHQ